MTGEKKMFTSCDMIENPTERIVFGGNGGGTVVGLGKNFYLNQSFNF
jgi:hypothetical protein